MVRGSEVVFSALLSTIWLQRRLNPWHVGGIALCTVRWLVQPASLSITDCCTHQLAACNPCRWTGILTAGPAPCPLLQSVHGLQAGITLVGAASFLDGSPALEPSAALATAAGLAPPEAHAAPAAQASVSASAILAGIALVVAAEAVQAAQVSRAGQLVWARLDALKAAIDTEPAAFCGRPKCHAVPSRLRPSQ